MKVKERFKKKWEKPVIKHLVPTKWLWSVSCPIGLHLEKFVDIGAYCYINARYGVSIETEVEIGSHTSIYSHNTINNTAGGVLIKKFAKIGSHCIIDPGVIIGEGAIVGAFSYVKTDIPDHETWAGVPAIRIK